MKQINKLAITTVTVILFSLLFSVVSFAAAPTWNAMWNENRLFSNAAAERKKVVAEGLFNWVEHLVSSDYTTQNRAEQLETVLNMLQYLADDLDEDEKLTCGQSGHNCSLRNLGFGSFALQIQKSNADRPLILVAAKTDFGYVLNCEGIIDDGNISKGMFASLENGKVFVLDIKDFINVGADTAGEEQTTEYSIPLAGSHIREKKITFENGTSAKEMAVYDADDNFEATIEAEYSKPDENTNVSSISVKGKYGENVYHILIRSKNGARSFCIVNLMNGEVVNLASRLVDGVTDLDSIDYRPFKMFGCEECGKLDCMGHMEDEMDDPFLREICDECGKPDCKEHVCDKCGELNCEGHDAFAMPELEKRDNALAKPDFEERDNALAKPDFEERDDVFAKPELEERDDAFTKPDFKVYGDAWIMFESKERCDECGEPDCKEHTCDECGELNCKKHACDECGELNCKKHTCDECGEQGCKGHGYEGFVKPGFEELEREEQMNATFMKNNEAESSKYRVFGKKK